MPAAGMTVRLRLVVRARVLLPEAREDRLHLRLRLVHGPAVRKPALQEEPAVPSLLDPRRPGVVVGRGLQAAEAETIDHHGRNPELGQEAGDDSREARRRHSHDRVGDAAQHDGLLEDVGPAAEPPLPHPVADYDDRVLPLPDVLFRPEATAERGPDAEDVEVVRADGLTGREHGLAPGRKDPPHEGVPGHPLEGVRPLEDRHVVGVGAGEVREVGTGARVDLHQPLGFGHGGGAEEDGVHHAEQRGVQADAEGQGKDGHRGEARPADE